MMHIQLLYRYIKPIEFAGNCQAAGPTKEEYLKADPVTSYFLIILNYFSVVSHRVNG